MNTNEIKRLCEEIKALGFNPDAAAGRQLSPEGKLASQIEALLDAPREHGEPSFFPLLRQIEQHGCTLYAGGDESEAWLDNEDRTEVSCSTLNALRDGGWVFFEDYNANSRPQRAVLTKCAKYAIESLSQPTRGSVLAEESLIRYDCYVVDGYAMFLEHPHGTYVKYADIERAADAPKEGWVSVEDDSFLVPGRVYTCLRTPGCYIVSLCRAPVHDANLDWAKRPHFIDHTITHYFSVPLPTAPTTPAPTQEGEER